MYNRQGVSECFDVAQGSSKKKNLSNSLTFSSKKGRELNCKWSMVLKQSLDIYGQKKIIPQNQVHK